MIGFITKLKQRTPLGWLQLRHDKTRLAVAIAGITFADILIFMQLGFMSALFESGVKLHRQIDADIVLLSPQARNLSNLSTFPRRRLYQAMDIEGIEATDALYIGFTDWKHPTTQKKTSMLLVGMNPDRPAFDIPEIQQNQGKIKLPDTLLFDRGTRGDYTEVIAQLEQGKTATTEIEKRTITIDGLIEVGASFTTDGVLMTSDQNFLRLFGRREASTVNLGLVQVTPGTDPEQIVTALNAQLPRDVKALTKEGFVTFETDYVKNNSAISFVFSLGAVMGFIVGVVIVYQILSTDVNDHMAEYATFKAMGYRHRYLLGVIFEEALILAALGFIPGVGVSIGLYRLTSAATALPLTMTLGRVVLVFMLTVVMCNVSGMVATRRLQSADPADIF
ncbi:MAG: ABC transporter permease DevC [Cyanobacteria bacterium P01_A01_bin.17]